MKSQIIPAILAKNEKEQCALLEVAAKFTNYVQIDFTDGSFAPTKTAPLTTNCLKTSELKFEVDLLVKNPMNYFDAAKAAGAIKVIIYYEATSDLFHVIKAARERGLMVALGNLKETPIHEFREYIALVDEVQFFTGKLGEYGGVFDISALPKIATVRAEFPDKDLGIDGGVTLANIAKIKAAGVNRFAVGSAIMGTADSKVSYKEFEKLIR